MPYLSRAIAAVVLAALPLLAGAQMTMLRPDTADLPSPTAALKPDGQIRYALGGSLAYLSRSSENSASVNLGADTAIATADSRWRLSGKALWSRTVGETAAESVTLWLVQESQHRWGGVWLRQRVSVRPPLRASEALRTTLETGAEIATSPVCNVNVGVLQRYDAGAAVKMADPTFTTAISLRLP